MIESPVFLTLDEVLQIHAYQIGEHGGASKIRDVGLLESAIAQARQVFDGKFLHVDLAHMAAAYLYHIVQNLPSKMETNGPARMPPSCFLL